MTAIALRRRASPPLTPDAWQGCHGFERMIAQEWVADARWEISRSDLETFATLSERLYAAAIATIDQLLGDERWLSRLGVSRVAPLLRASRKRAALVTRLDFALDPLGGGRYLPRLLEFNGDTAGNLVEGGMLQEAWGQALGLQTTGSSLVTALRAALASLPRPLVIWHHPGEPYLVDLARYLALLAEVPRIAYPDVPAYDANAYKLFRWGRLWIGRFPEVGNWIAGREHQTWEPPWASLLQHKGVLAAMWAFDRTLPGLLPATLDGPSALPEPGRGWVTKTFHGSSGQEVCVHPAGEVPGAATDGAIDQQLVPIEAIDGRYAILCATLVRGRFAAALMREDRTFVSREDIVAPLVIRGHT